MSDKNNDQDLSIEVKRSIPEGLIALITGAGSGVGETVAVELARHNIKIALVGRTKAKLLRVLKTIQCAGGQAAIFPCDVSQKDQVKNLKLAVLNHFGHPQILFNSAGIYSEIVPIGKLTPNKWIEAFMINTIGPYLTCRAFMGEMMNLGWGRIINVSSAASLGSISNISSVYQLSKIALNQFTRQLALEFDGTGVTANVFHPGVVKTEMWLTIKEEIIRHSESAHEMLDWVKWLEETGGDSLEKSATGVLDLIESGSESVNGQFLWIKEGLKKTMPSW